MRAAFIRLKDDRLFEGGVYLRAASISGNTVYISIVTARARPLIMSPQVGARSRSPQLCTCTNHSYTRLVQSRL